jgi:hypothetical protein
VATAQTLLDWGRRQLGTTENPAGSNRVRYWDDVGMHKLQTQPWCAAFYLAGLLATGVTPVSRSVYVPRLVTDYKNADRLFPIDKAKPGDQVLYNIGDGHTGIVVSISAASRTVIAIEGNTSAGAAGSQNNGGGVYMRVRPWSVVTGVGRPSFTNPLPAKPEAPMRMFVIDPKGVDDLGRDSVWEIDEQGNVFNWNAARPLKSRREVDPGATVAIVAAVPDPSGDGVVMIGADDRQDNRGHWVRSTWRIVAGS